MFASTLSRLFCPRCQADLKTASAPSPEKSVEQKDIQQGQTTCTKCQSHYPILAGVLILVSDVEDYLLSHAKGISRYVKDQDIPQEFRKDFIHAKKEIESEHIEEDLEAERVTSLYIMTHYLKSKSVISESPALQKVIADYWDHGPFAKIHETLSATFKQDQKKKSLIEFGCGSGGLLTTLQDLLTDYLGVDQSFASVVLARHLALGAPLPHGISVPHDLLNGATSRAIQIETHPPQFMADFIVCDINEPPIRPAKWDLCAALNIIDMLPKPESLPKLQAELLKPSGLAIQSSPYIWHPEVAKELRQKSASQNTSSEKTIEVLYQKYGLKIKASFAHVPWVFFKNYRQIELYSAHLFFAQK